MNKRTLYIAISFLAILILASGVLAADEIVQSADRLNFWDAVNHTVRVTNTGTNSTNVSIALPAGWSFTSGSGCSLSGSNIDCVLAGSASATYTVQSPGLSANEYTTTDFVVVTNNSYTGNDVSMVRIACSEIFHTLVEYGRGRGNYFYNSNSGAAGSGQTGTGCSYVPADSFMELNFLHKTYNVKQYFNVVADAYNASYSCTYPNSTIVRQHLDTAITRSSVWDVDFFIDEISGSWERFGYIGMQFDAGEYSAGQNITINCTDMNYNLPVAGGNMSCSEDSFTLQFVSREPFIAGATAVGTVYNGTQEIEISYVITNNEAYDVSNVVIEIQAPANSQFIGTRGELWGYAQDIYRIERSDFQAGESETITLVARVDTTTAGPITALNLTEGIEIQYTTCWEYNAYNPAEYIQAIVPNGTLGGGPGGAIGNITVDMNQNVSIVNIINYITNIYNIQQIINTTVFDINTTVYQILNLSQLINLSIGNVSYNVWAYDTRTLTYYPATTGGTAGGAVACRWDYINWYNDSLTTNIEYVYANHSIRVDFPNIYNGTVDAWQICHRTSPQTATTGTDVLEIYVCNDYNGSSIPDNDPACTLTDSEDPTESAWVANHLKWECDDVLTQEISGTNISILYVCDTCNDTTDAWEISVDTTVDNNMTYNSSDLGLSWTNVTGEALTDWSWCIPIDYGAEVWAYENRTLTSYNFSALFDQFNCTSGASTNRMCALLEAINLTTVNMQTTVNQINSTVNGIATTVSNIYSDTQSILTDTFNILTGQGTILTNIGTVITNQGTIIGNQGTIITITSTILDVLNCNGTTDTPLCQWFIDLNLTVTNLNNTINNINYTLNSVNASIFIMNQSIHDRFNDVDGNITLLYNISINIQDLLNCTNLSTQYNDSVCNRLQRLENWSIDINNSLQSVLNIVNYINGSRWLNYTVQDILDAIQNQTTNDISRILLEIQRLRQFDEELVFLVTDAFNAQTRAKSEVESGDFTGAQASLEQARMRLDQAAVRLTGLQSEEEAILGSSSNAWWIWIVLVGLIVVLAVYLFQKVPEEEEPRQYKF